MRTSRRSGPQLPSEKKKRENRDKKKTESRHSSDDDDADWEPDFGSRSLGKVCVYGTRGEVVFRPRGAQDAYDALQLAERQVAQLYERWSELEAKLQSGQG